MTAWTTISNTIIASGKAGTTGLFTALRDNLLAAFEGASGAPKILTAAIQDLAVTTAKINDLAVTNGKIADFGIGVYKLSGASVKQYALDTSQGEVSSTLTPSGDEDIVTLPGGEYGFFPETKVSSTTNNDNRAFIDTQNATYGIRLIFHSEETSTGTVTAYARQRYVNSSPPYNLGNGDVPLFVFVRLGANGAIKTTYAADVPPWAYNGPTRVTADRHDAATGKKYQTLATFDRETGDLAVQEREVTNAVKNADMSLIPHPFSSLKPGERVIILEPCATEKLYHIQRAGESIAELLHGDYLRLGNDISVASSPGVTPVNFKFKNSK